MVLHHCELSYWEISNGNCILMLECNDAVYEVCCLDHAKHSLIATSAMGQHWQSLALVCALWITMPGERGPQELNAEVPMCGRFAIGAVSLEDLAPGARSPMILSPTPHCVDERRHGRRPIMQRFFQVRLPCPAAHCQPRRHEAAR